MFLLWASMVVHTLLQQNTVTSAFINIIIAGICALLLHNLTTQLVKCYLKCLDNFADQNNTFRKTGQIISTEMHNIDEWTMGGMYAHNFRTQNSLPQIPPLKKSSFSRNMQTKQIRHQSLHGYLYVKWRERRKKITKEKKKKNDCP